MNKVIVGSTAAKDDACAPNDGIEFNTDTKAYLKITQDFRDGIKATFDTETYQKGVYNVSLPLDMSIWFEKDPEIGSFSEVASTEQYTVYFSGTNSQTVYYDADGKFALHTPRMYAAAVGTPETRIAVAFSEGPLTVNGYVDKTTFEIGAELSILGIDLGVLSGNLNKGLNLYVHLAAVAGMVNLKSRENPVGLQRAGGRSHQVWASVNLTILFLAQARYTEDKSVLTWFDD
ncbi:hypothetical protein AOQ84DRAFT_361099 [Glonium stellatum]|uniref:Uncharacterized protein n=1 Tax=Glonium stellatum TaxID=574774 RepID=A0A8E2JWM6_9PEZI|nr:hypothetical protein AOQ84DRAFT_361099 [Glonium stellatum]